MDLSPVPNLRYLSCEGNDLSELDLTPCKGMSGLWIHHFFAEHKIRRFDNEKITKIDLSYCHNFYTIPSVRHDVEVIRKQNDPIDKEKQDKLTDQIKFGKLSIE